MLRGYLCHSRVGGNPVTFNVIPWLDHGISYRRLSPKIPRSSRGMTPKKLGFPLSRE
ncbi:MAG: hypothetical protein ACEY3D_01320 [Rickettsia sp.]|uniref:hypothetical protein n=1 Tax=Rickettsia sp. TaxID=789 RepID=UPI00397B2648